MQTPVLDPGRRPLGPIGLRAPLPSTPIGPGPARRAVTPNATIAARIDLTPSMARFVVRPDGAVPPFKPGQYFALGLDVDGMLRQRPYSTASLAGSDELEFLVKRVSTGTFTPLLWQTGPGDRVWLGPPKGLFTLTPGDPRTHLLISTGTGLAPFISMAEALLSDPGATGTAGRRAVVIHGVSYLAELAYRDRLESWAAGGRLAYVPTVSRPADPPNAGWTGATGRTEAVLSRVCDDFGLEPDRTVAYICGNPDMIEAASRILLGRGFEDPAVIRERYWTEPNPAAG